MRHPIYSGTFSVLLGTALVSGLPGLVALPAFGVVAVYRIGVEERLMVQFLGEACLEYRARKTLVPCVV